MVGATPVSRSARRVRRTEEKKSVRMPDLEFDWRTATRHLREVDRRFSRVIESRPEPLVPRRLRSPHEALVRSIIYQQLSGKAAGTIHRRLLELCPARRPTPAALRSLDDEALRGAGISRGKIRALRDLSERSLAGDVPGYAALKRLSDEEIIELLTRIHGVGRWTVEMLLIFQLGRPDVLPLGDLGVRKAFARLRGRGGDVTPAQLARASAKWRPYRTVASWYCYRILDPPTT